MREILAESLERFVDADERLHLLTITEVACEPDLRNATVFLASMSSEAKEALEEHRKALQAVIGTQVRMKRVPMLHFVEDPAVIAGEAVERALRRARESGDQRSS